MEVEVVSSEGGEGGEATVAVTTAPVASLAAAFLLIILGLGNRHDGGACKITWFASYT
jgi:hypothetical protein